MVLALAASLYHIMSLSRSSLLMTLIQAPPIVCVQRLLGERVLCLHDNPSKIQNQEIQVSWNKVYSCWKGAETVLGRDEAGKLERVRLVTPTRSIRNCEDLFFLGGGVCHGD